MPKRKKLGVKPHTAAAAVPIGLRRSELIRANTEALFLEFTGYTFKRAFHPETPPKRGRPKQHR
jgi:hypothetical protein